MHKDFIEAPLYKPFAWKGTKSADGRVYFSAEDSENILKIMRIGKTVSRFYCSQCQNEESHSHTPLFSVVSVSNSKDYTRVMNSSNQFTSLYYRNDGTLFFSSEEKVRYTQTYKCNYNKRHEVFIDFTMSTYDDILEFEKCGQSNNPIVYSQQQNSLYEKDLDFFEVKSDYFTSLHHMYNGDFVAAMLYSRRVFERIIHKLMGDHKLEKDTMQNKIKYLRTQKILEPTTEELSSSVYSLLSKGVHKLSNEQCKDLFGNLFIFIQTQLNYQIIIRRNKEASNIVKSGINRDYKRFLDE